ncbi:hypothetical protein [Bradyrhizobium phage BDU-MI-1]|nr:hypothetical protein [Bradyrhizobium phage BDU-MI-1]
MKNALTNIAGAAAGIFLLLFAVAINILWACLFLAIPVYILLHWVFGVI